ncbi:phosphate acetyltransferase [Streptomyces sodiiphilus]|uniref:Phosphate acetyltransferase n=1 Tax=Streptomyces sodiiphilus TaxID=226217 RepID=A0ABP5A4X0_9ACTN
MTRSVYVTGIGRGDGRQVVELGIMELLTRQVDRVGVFRPLGHDGTDPVLGLLTGRYRLGPGDHATGMSYAEAAALQADLGTDELITRLVDRFHTVARDHEAVLVLGTDFADTGLPAELALNARLANEFGAVVLPVVGGLAGPPPAGGTGRRGQSAEALVAEVRNAHDAYTSLGCEVLATVVNRVSDSEALRAALSLGEQLPEPVHVVPEDPALSAPTVRQIADALGARVLQGDQTGMARDVRDFVFGGATIQSFLPALTEGCLVLAPGDRADLVIGALAAHSAGSPPIAGILLTLDLHPGRETLWLAERLAPGTPVLLVPGGSFRIATELSGLEGQLTAASPRKAEIALGLFESHVDTAALSRRLSVVRSDRVTPMMFEHELIERARTDRRHVVLPEGTEERVLRAAEVLLRRNVCDLTLLGEETAVRKRAADLGLDLRLLSADEVAAEDGVTARVVDPQTSPLRERLAEVYAKARRHRGVTYELAYDVVCDVSYFGTLMVHEGLVDGMVSGAAHSTAATIRPAFEVIRTKPDTSIVSSVFFMCLADKVLVYGDCAVNPEPDAEELADIAIQSAATARQFGVEPRVAMLSYSTGDSGSGAEVDKVRRATELVRERRPELLVEGPIQYDAAVEPVVAAAKLPGSEVAGQATVLIFPDLNTGNNTYKAVQRSAGAVAVGPVMQGLRKPVNDLSRGALVQDIINTVAITAVQAQGDPPSERKEPPA